MPLRRQNKPTAVDRLAQLNDPGEIFKNPQSLAFFRQFIEIVREMAKDTIYRNAATTAVLLTAPNGTVYEISANDNGSLKVVNVRNPTVVLPITIPPTTDPHVAGAIWNQAGVLKISAG